MLKQHRLIFHPPVSIHINIKLIHLTWRYTIYQYYREGIVLIELSGTVLLVAHLELLYSH